MAQGKLTIHTENILPIIKKWLYSEKDIFVRELVCNATDALSKLKVLQSRSQVELSSDEELRIDLHIDKEKSILTISDSGIGMTAEEVEKYIAQVAFSGAEEFLGKYKSESEQEQIIGHFGLGFYSAYMVAEKVEISTLSYQKGAEAVSWSCAGTHEYTIDKGSRETRGTAIALFIDKENREYLEEKRLQEILHHYCAFLPFPIYLNGERINSKEPLWTKTASECSEKDYLDFHRLLYPLDPDPVFWVHLNVDYPFHLKGILYFPQINRRFDWSKSQIKLFCNRVFVSDNCKDLIPDYLTVLKGALDSPDIPLNVSRSTLQMDKTVRQLATHISKKIADRLSQLYQNQRQTFIEAWSHIEMVVKLGILQDEKFYEKAKEFLIWKNQAGEWVTVEEYLERQKESAKNKVFYTTQEHHHCLDLYKAQGIEVLHANGHIDAALITFLERTLTSVQFQRIDGAIDNAILDKEREKSLLDTEGKSEAAKIAEFIRAQLSSDRIEVEAKSLASDSLPAFIVLSEEMRRLRDYMALSNQPLPAAFGDKHTFVVNTNSELISALYQMKEKKPELAKEAVTHLYELSLLSQKELEPEKLGAFIARSTKVMHSLLLP
jgi:molecular chaperone HtpG